MIPQLFLKFIAPCAFLKLRFGPETAGQIYPGCLARLFYDRYDIVAKFDVFNTEYSSVNAGRADDLPLFAKIDRGEGRFDFFGGPRFYLGKTEDIAIECDQVDLARHLYTLAVSSDWNPEIGCNETEAFSFEIPGREGFTMAAEVLS